ncbi:somatomedin-B and thrombospondin type-1 domain-containing protein-like [Xyrauchen texanus]|uniref:somatomedin-B and thrombospondin type-1 domain-containing protein-like n=1 Tax=Xyrauchen texanus TaxID=154827 RepID=UPI0022425B4C|nr:somatomedin-B and thrombospondin type-1 domain-containing protein-like [Xyrauchen texanus]
MGLLSVEQNVLLFVTILFAKYRYTEGGCSGRCCHGTDLTCFTTDWRMDHVYGMCYCDEMCVKTKDCCFDYPIECPAQPCVVSEWSHWSGCAQLCQPSFRVRRRSIERGPRNSIQVCPRLEEQAGCMEYQNHHRQFCAQTQGAAFITTMEYSKGRVHDLYGALLDAGFCMEFKMESLTPQCMVENRPYTRWMQYLREGYTVCVACQSPAMSNHSRSCQGDGNLAERDELLHWQAVGSPHCRGTWRKVQRLEHCSCPQVHSFIFI